MNRKRGILTDKKRELFDRVLAAEKYQEEVFTKDALIATKMLRGKDLSYLPGKFRTDKAVSPNLLFSTIRNYVPALYPKNQKIYLKPTAPTWSDPPKDNCLSAYLMQASLENYNKKLKMPVQDKRASLCSLVQGVGYGWNAWVFEADTSYNPSIRKDQPMHRFLPGTELIVDPDCIDFEDKSFVARIFGRRSEYMRAMGYEVSDEKIKSNDVEKVQYHGQAAIDTTTGMPLLSKYYEVYDKASEMIYLFSSDAQNPEILEERKFDISKGYPFTPLIYNPMIDNYFGMSLVDVLVPLQRFITLLMTWGMEHVKRSVPKILYFDEYMDAAAKKRFQNDQDMGLVPFKMRDGAQNQRKISEVVMNWQAPGLPSDFGALMALGKDFINILSGVHSAARGESSGTEKTATEASLLDAYLRSRYDDYRNITDQFVIDTREKIITLIKDNASKDRFLRFNLDELESQYFMQDPAMKPRGPAMGAEGEILQDELGAPIMEGNPDVQKKGNYIFVKWNKEMVSGEYDIEVGTGPGLPVNEEFEFKKNLNIYNLFAKDPYVNPVKLRTHIFRNLKVPNPEQFITAPPPPPKEEARISVSIKYEDLEAEQQQMVLAKGGLITAPSPAQAGPGGASLDGTAVNSGMLKELGRPGLEMPPGPEL